jgi:hypothetical protein
MIRFGLLLLHEEIRRPPLPFHGIHPFRPDQIPQMSTKIGNDFGFTERRLHIVGCTGAGRRTSVTR